MNAARILSSGAVLLPSAFLGSADAHHSFRMHYDPDRSIELQGVVAEVDLRSPHSFFFVDALGADGVMQRWEVEAASLVHLRRLGIHPDTFQPGDSITVDAWPNLVPNNPLIWGQAFTAADGTRYGGPPTADRADPGTQPTAGIERMAGRWLAPPPVTHPESPLPLTDAGWDAWRNYDPQLSPANTCEPISIPDLLYAPYLSSIEFREGEVFFHHEAYDITRTVPLNGESRQAEPTGVLGTVSGRIEGDTLIVESSGFPRRRGGWASQSIPTAAEPTCRPAGRRGSSSVTPLARTTPGSWWRLHTKILSTCSNRILVASNTAACRRIRRGTTMFVRWRVRSGFLGIRDSLAFTECCGALRTRFKH